MTDDVASLDERDARARSDPGRLRPDRRIRRKGAGVAHL
jgi:hypothetical protein